MGCFVFLQGEGSRKDVKSSARNIFALARRFATLVSASNPSGGTHELPFHRYTAGLRSRHTRQPLYAGRPSYPAGTGGHQQRSLAARAANILRHDRRLRASGLRHRRHDLYFLGRPQFSNLLLRSQHRWGHELFKLGTPVRIWLGAHNSQPCRPAC